MSDKKKTPAFELNAFTNIFSTPSVVTGPAGVPWYETLNCQDSVDMVYEYGQKAGEAFIGMGYFLKRIRDKELFKELGYETMTALAKDKFKMDDSAVCRMVNFCEKYSENNNSPVLDSKYKEYNQSQLIEMLSIKDEKIIEKITPDTTVREIREIKKQAAGEPSDYYIRKFFNHELIGITPEEFADLKNYMISNYGKSHTVGGGIVSYNCSPRGISINASSEITWSKFVSRVYLLEDLVPNSIKNQSRTNEDNLPGQMNMEEHFPQYCPDNQKSESIGENVVQSNENCDVAILSNSNSDSVIKFPEKENVIIDGEFREIPITKANSTVKEFAKNCAIGAHNMFCGVCMAEEVSKDKLGQALLNNDKDLLLDVSKNFAKYLQDEIAFDVENAEVQNFQNIIELIIGCCEENNWFEE